MIRLSIYLLSFLLSFGLLFPKSYIVRHTENFKISDDVQKKYSLTAEKLLSNTITSNKKINEVLQNKSSEEFYKILQNYTIINVNDAKSDDFLNELNKSDEIIEIFPNTIFHVCSPKDNELGKDYPKQWNIRQLNVPKAWNKANGEGVLIALVDTGIDFEHPDLKNGLWINIGEDLNKNGTFEPWSYLEKRNGIAGDFNGIDDDGNGYSDDVIGYDFVDQLTVGYGDYSNPDPIPEDEGEHGTNVAGIMIAQPNENGIIGISYKSKLLISKAFDITGNAEADDIAKAIIYSVLNGAKVINMSFGDDYPSPIVYDAVRFAYSAGCILIASSGNNGWNYPHYPSDYPEVISVGGSTETEDNWSFGNYGPYLDVIAPARAVYTTDVGGTYKSTNGTSVAAPHVSAIAALILDINPNLTNDDLKTIIQLSARNRDYSLLSGAGIIDAGRAVDNIFNGEIRFISPKFDEIINNENDKIEIFGTITNPLFDYAVLTISQKQNEIYGDNPGIMINQQIVNVRITTLETSQLKEGLNYLSIKVYLQNKKNIIETIPVYYYPKNSNLKIEYFNMVSSFKNEKRIQIIGAKTNLSADFQIKYRIKGSGSVYKTLKEFQRNTSSHGLIIEDMQSETSYEGIAEFITGKDTITKDFEFYNDGSYFTTKNFNLKTYNTNRSYIYNELTDLYSDNKKTFVVNDLQSLYIGKTYVKQFNEGKFENRDSLEKGYIPVGFGDSNGDGIPEVLTSAEFNTILYQSYVKNGNPFKTELFKNVPGTSLWGEQMFDIDKDGKDEIIGYRYEVNEKGYSVYKYSGDKYVEIARTQLPENLINISIERSSALEDLDGDGKYELCFVNTRGNILIYEFTGNDLIPEYIDSTDVGYGNQYMTKADVDGDGIYEVIHGSYGSNQVVSEDGSWEQLWRFRMIKSSAPNTYATIWNENFYPVRSGSTRQGVFYRNGLTSGNLDNNKGDEIVISTFPNLYIFRWNESKSSFENFWYYPSTLTNSALIADIDGNGINEIGFTTFNAMRFFEYDTNFDGPQPPSNIDGWAENDSTVYIEWSKVTDADKYAVYMLVSENGEIMAKKIVESTANSVLLTGFKPNFYYDFILKTISSKFKDKESDFSNVLTVFTGRKTIPLSVTDIKANSMIINFSNKLPVNKVEPGVFAILGNNFNLIPTSPLTLNDTSCIIYFKDSIPEGNYNLQINSFRDYYRNHSTPKDFGIEIKYEKPEPELYLTYLEFVSESLIKLHFSDTLDRATSENRNNYIIKPIGEALFVELDVVNPNAVLINISQFFRESGARGRNYTITVNNVLNDKGKKITDGPGNTLGFVFYRDDLRDAYIYPNPIKYSDNPDIFFANLTPSATVTITTLDGVDIIKLTERDGNGGVEWDGKDGNGNPLPTGIYLFKVEGRDSENRSVFSETKKFVILP